MEYLKIPFFLILFCLLNVHLFAEDEEPEIILQPVDQTVCLDDSVSFFVQATGFGELKYQWQKNGTDLEDERDSILVIPSAIISDTGFYRCIVSNDNGSDTSTAAELTVDIVSLTEILGPHEVENYDTALFSVIVTAGHSYEFFVQQGTILAVSDTSVLVEWGVDEVGYVNVLESSANGCYGDTAQHMVIIGNVAPFFLSQPVSQTICFADSAHFEAPAAGTSELNYQWQLNGEDLIRETDEILSIPSATLDDEGDYRCIVSNNVGSDTSDIATLDIDFVEPAEISGEDMVDVNDTATYTIVPQEGHTYEFGVMRGNILETSDSTIKVEWDSAGISQVFLIETNTMGCIGDTVFYQVLVFGDGTEVIFLVQPESQGVCLNDSVSLFVEAEGYPELIYQWQKNEVDIENANDSLLTIPNAQYEDAAEYRCIVSNDFGADTSSNAVLAVDEIVPSTILGPQFVKEFEIVVYSVGYTEGHVYDFEVDGGNIIESTENSITVHWGASGTGEVRMLESVENGCVGEWVHMVVYVGTVGIDVKKEKEISIIPNPFSNNLRITNQGQHIIRIYDMVGSLVLERSFNNETKLSLSYLPPGMYIYRMEESSGRIIKNR